MPPRIETSLRSTRIVHKERPAPYFHRAGLRCRPGARDTRRCRSGSPEWCLAVFRSRFADTERCHQASKRQIRKPSPIHLDNLFRIEELELRRRLQPGDDLSYPIGQFPRSAPRHGEGYAVPAGASRKSARTSQMESASSSAASGTPRNRALKVAMTISGSSQSSLAADSSHSTISRTGSVIAPSRSCSAAAYHGGASLPTGRSTLAGWRRWLPPHRQDVGGYGSLLVESNQLR